MTTSAGSRNKRFFIGVELTKIMLPRPRGCRGTFNFAHGVESARPDPIALPLRRPGISSASSIAQTAFEFPNPHCRHDQPLGSCQRAHRRLRRGIRRNHDFRWRWSRRSLLALGRSRLNRSATRKDAVRCSGRIHNETWVWIRQPRDCRLPQLIRRADATVQNEHARRV